VWHCSQLCRDGWVDRIGFRPFTPWQLSHRSRIVVRCGICGGPIGWNRGPASGDASPANEFGTSRGSGGTASAPGTGPAHFL
jgi:hypothetical protein